MGRGPLMLRARDRGGGAADDAPGRFGFAVSSRLGGAVVRNRIKRRLRAAAQRCEADGLDIVVIARDGAQRADFQTLDESLRELVRLAVKRLGRGDGGEG